jgi:hypothetical protein
MATEHIVDLEHQRYADREYEGPLPENTGAAEQAKAERQALAVARLRKRVREPPGGQIWLSRSDLLDLLIVMGADDW